MKLCPFCGSELNDDAKFCGECGKPLPEEAPLKTEIPAEPAAAEPAAAVIAQPAAPAESAASSEPVIAPTEPVIVPAAPVAEPVQDMPVITQMPPKKQMLSTFQYVLLTMLYSIPVIGLVFLFIFGAGHPKNGSLKRFSAALLILRLVFWIAVLALLIVAMVKNGRLLSDALGQLVPAVENLLKAIFA